jgi:hypothetical protein
MSTDTGTLVKTFRRALELAARERAGEPVPSVWRDYLKAFPTGCCELASQTLARYLMDHNKKLFPYVIGMQWDDNEDRHGHVIVALNGDYIDLTLDQFDGYDDWIVAEPIESGGQLGIFIQEVRNLGGTLSTRELTFDGIPDQAWKLYDWLKATADSLLPAAGQPCSTPVLVSREILTEYQNLANTDPTNKTGHAPEKKKQKKMTHTGIVSDCYRPREVRLRQTSTMWISECGLKFRKATGAASGSGVWSSRRLDLSSIREIRPDE